MNVLFDIFKDIFIGFFKTLSIIIEIIPTFIELKNVPINTISLANGVPALVISIIITMFRNRY